MRSTLLRRLAGGLSLFIAGHLAYADVTLAPLFTDHAVLQRDKPVPIWGWADSGEKVTVTFQGKTGGATATSDGRWIVYLEAFPALAQGADLTVAGKNTMVLHDVVVGEVWLCSGQSNMEFAVNRVQNAAQEISSAHFPLLRHFTVQRAVATTPSAVVKTSGWEQTTPETVGRFTAVGYFFARDLHQKLGVPFGLIHSSWGGSPIESWLSPAALASNPAFAVANTRWQQMLADLPAKKMQFDAELLAWERAEAAARAAGPDKHALFLKQRPKPRAPSGEVDHWRPTGLYNGMINPLVPYALRGLLWYQGESNADHANEYHALFASMITMWRRHFGQGDFPFYWVSLANYRVPDPSGRSYAFLREAQTQTLTLPHTGQALAIDVGSPEDVHPANKQDVGRRLALIARTETYGIPGDYVGPTFVSATREGTAMRVRLLHAGGLVPHNKPVQSLELAGADRKFYPATAKIDREMLVVSSPSVREPVAVRYAWTNSPEANLYNGAGLPAVPFRSDNW
jgi:sialate O-acetylesterase